DRAVGGRRRGARRGAGGAFRERRGAGDRARGAGAGGGLSGTGRAPRARCAALAARDGRVVAQVGDVPAPGWFAAPTVVADLPPDSPVVREEIFGPLLAVTRVRDMEAACEVVDSLPFALTGGLFS